MASGSASLLFHTTMRPPTCRETMPIQQDRTPLTRTSPPKTPGRVLAVSRQAS